MLSKSGKRSKAIQAPVRMSKHAAKRMVERNCNHGEVIHKVVRNNKVVTVYPINKNQVKRKAVHSSLKVKIPDSAVGLIIGKGGSTIKSIQERTGASIQIPSQADSDDPTVRTCVIIHPEKTGCDNAKELMEVVLLKRNSGAGGGATIALGAGWETDTILVPDKDIGMIIGRAGCNIKELQRQSTSRIQIPPKADPGTQHRTCTITGSRAGTDFLTGGTAYAGQQQSSGGRPDVPAGRVSPDAPRSRKHGKGISGVVKAAAGGAATSPSKRLPARKKPAQRAKGLWAAGASGATTTTPVKVKKGLKKKRAVLSSSEGSTSPSVL
ncbi:hypothetical protein TrST_g11929 [Triparma strigata]|uniref:K Homology domain-containing protein n=1 Tax=Triparma strigata TaxID=1606541 RepID=A0A9W7BJ00_9STRA|nr:hypothetical protein TrST_g11929 [Triparma strigata]